MKVKLLRKVRKRFEWYFNRSGYPILIDKKRKHATVYDLDYCLRRSGYKEEQLPLKVTIKHAEWALRYMKADALYPFGITWDKIFYHNAMKNLNRLKTFTYKGRSKN